MAESSTRTILDCKGRIRSLEGVVEVFPDSKGLVRRAKGKVKSGILDRPVDKLCLIVEREDPE